MAHALSSSCTLLRKGLRGSFREDHSVDENKLGLECLLRGLDYLGVPFTICRHAYRSWRSTSLKDAIARVACKCPHLEKWEIVMSVPESWNSPSCWTVLELLAVQLLPSEVDLRLRVTVCVRIISQ
jgi:hypothetical protein